MDAKRGSIDSVTTLSVKELMASQDDNDRRLDYSIDHQAPSPPPAYSKSKEVSPTTKLVLITAVAVTIILGACIVAASYIERQNACSCDLQAETPAADGLIVEARAFAQPLSSVTEQPAAEASPSVAGETTDSSTAGDELKSDNNKKEKDGKAGKGKNKNKGKKNKNKKNKNKRPIDDIMNSSPIRFQMDELAKMILEREESALVNCMIRKRKSFPFAEVPDHLLEVSCHGSHDEPVGPMTLDMPFARHIIPSEALFSIPMMQPMQSQRWKIIRPRQQLREQMPQFPLSSIDQSGEDEGQAKLTTIDMSTFSDSSSNIPPYVAAVLKLFQSAGQGEPINKPSIISQHVSLEPRLIEDAPIVRAMKIRMTEHEPQQQAGNTVVPIRRFIPVNHPNHSESPAEQPAVPHFLPQHHPASRVTVLSHQQTENQQHPQQQLVELMTHHHNHDDDDEEEEDDDVSFRPLFHNAMPRFNQRFPMPPPHRGPFMPFQRRDNNKPMAPFFVGRNHHARSDIGHHFIRPRSLLAAPEHVRKDHAFPVQHL